MPWLAIGLNLLRKGRREKIISCSKSLPARIETAVFPNNRRNKHCLRDGAPVDHFLVYLSLTLSQREVAAIQEIQDALVDFPKDQVRFRTEKNAYCNSIEFRCYFRDPTEIEIFVRAALSGFNLVRSPCLGSEEKKCPVSLGHEAQLAVRYSERLVDHSAKSR